MPMTEDRRDRLHAALEKALTECEAALKPVFDAGAYHLPADELELLHEVSFKLGILRSVVLHRDISPAEAEKHWQEDKARRARALSR
ncbi:hypothetical protein [Labrys sp. 22185]|uniref:hypothetical protein n=1 Tax=Labrys sp. 22185 TaxID=3453888 RepID=UPI003F878371